MLSHYECAVYDRLYSGWNKYTYQSFKDRIKRRLELKSLLRRNADLPILNQLKHEGYFKNARHRRGKTPRPKNMNIFQKLVIKMMIHVIDREVKNIPLPKIIELRRKISHYNRLQIFANAANKTSGKRLKDCEEFEEFSKRYCRTLRALTA